MTRHRRSQRMGHRFGLESKASSNYSVLQLTFQNIPRWKNGQVLRNVYAGSVKLEKFDLPGAGAGARMIPSGCPSASSERCQGDARVAHREVRREHNRPSPRSRIDAWSPAPSDPPDLAIFRRRSSDRRRCSGTESVAPADESQRACPATASRSFAACSGCDKTLGIRHRMDSGACASRAHEKRCRPPFPLPLPESIAATPAANSSQDP
jgi:hypothetical protein